MKGKGKASSVMVKPSKAGTAPVTFPGKAVMQESKSKGSGFKKGGAVMSAAGDCAPAKAGKKMRKASGGAVTMQGRSPLSAASNPSMPSGKTTH